MSKKKRICLIIPQLGVGGMQRVMSELANYFAKLSTLEVHLIMYAGEFKVFYSLPANVKIHKPKFDYNKNLRIIYIIRIIFFLRQQVIKINPDTILSFGEYWNNLVMLALLKVKYPIYLSDRCKPDKSFGIFHNNLRKYLYPKSSGIIAQTTIAKKIYLNQFRHSNISVIGNPIRKIYQDNLNEVERENIVLSVGRLIPTKNYDLLIDIFLNIKQDWRLVIVGGDVKYGRLYEELDSKIKKRNAEGKIILENNSSNIDEYYLKSKIFAFTSSSEGFPNVIGEALSSGLPVVAFDCIAGPSDMIQNNVNGFLVSLFDSSTFEEKLELLMCNKSLLQKMSVNARDSIEKFSVDLIADEYLDFLTENEFNNAINQY